MGTFLYFRITRRRSVWCYTSSCCCMKVGLESAISFLCNITVMDSTLNISFFTCFRSSCLVFIFPAAAKVDYAPCLDFAPLKKKPPSIQMMSKTKSMGTYRLMQAWERIKTISNWSWTFGSLLKRMWSTVCLGNYTTRIIPCTGQQSWISF